MSRRIIITLIIISVFTIGLFLFNSNQMEFWYNVQVHLIICKALLFVSFVSVIISSVFGRAKKVGIIIFILSISTTLIINTYLWSKYYTILKKQYRLEEYEEIVSCSEMEMRFKMDLEKDEIKYFEFGIGSTLMLDEIMDENYNVEAFSMGCLVREEFECYNELVEIYLKEKYAKSLDEIYEEVHGLTEERYGPI